VPKELEVEDPLAVALANLEAHAVAGNGGDDHERDEDGELDAALAGDDPTQDDCGLAGEDEADEDRRLEKTRAKTMR